ncbi:MAG TPA: hypothetical protein VGD34_07020 [Kribbella sp.]
MTSSSRKVRKPVPRRRQRSLLHQTGAGRALSVGLMALVFTGGGPGQGAQASLEVPAIASVVSNVATTNVLDLLPVQLIEGGNWLYSETVSATQLLLDAASQIGAAASTDLTGGHAATAAMPVGNNAASIGSILTSGQSDRAATQLAGLSSADRTRVDATLAAAASPEEREYVLKALAAGHSTDEVVKFAQTIHGRKPRWLATHLSLIDLSSPGDLSYHGSPVDQVDNTTCGSASILVARAMADPLYALYLTTGNSTDPAQASAAHFQARLTAEEQRIHSASNEIWPQSLGTSPWGIASELNRYATTTGTQYGWHPVIATSTGSNPTLLDAIKAVENGHPVPVLIGDFLPRHYVLMVGQVGTDLLFYDPSAAAIVQVKEQDFLRGDTTAIGFPHIEAVITPGH